MKAERRFFTLDDVRQRLRSARGNSSLDAWCFAKGIDRLAVIEFAQGKSNPPKALLGALGLEYRIVEREKVEEGWKIEGFR